jgi:hypothetical protein
VSVPCLDAEQSLTWAGPWPADPAGLPDLMERLHFAVVDHHTLGLVSSRRTAAGVSIDLLGRFSIMRFEPAGDAVEPGRAVRRYRLPPSLATRRAPGQATFELGAEQVGEQIRAWVQVANFPSVMLSCPPPGPTLYPAFHAHVSNAYLRVLRSRLA